jgi:hypothetical protein
LAARFIAKKDPDLVAELLSCMRYLRFQDKPMYRNAIEYLLSSQNPDGSYGRYPRMEKRYGPYAKQGFYLHTTAVVLEALSIAMDPRFNR